MTRTVQQPTILDPTQHQGRRVDTQRSQGSAQPVEQPMFPPGVEGIQQRTTRTPLVNISKTRVHYESHVTHHAPTPGASSSPGIGFKTKLKFIGTLAVIVFLMSQHPNGLAGGVAATAGVIADLIGIIASGSA